MRRVQRRTLTRAVALVAGLTLYNSAVIAEIMRAGILSLDRGQRDAAAALGLNYRQQMTLVILPQGLRRMVPATVSQLITLPTDTTLVSIIAIVEVMRRARTVTATSGNPFTGGGVDEAGDELAGLAAQVGADHRVEVRLQVPAQ